MSSESRSAQGPVPVSRARALLVLASLAAAAWAPSCTSDSGNALGDGSTVLDTTPPAVAAASVVYLGDQTNPLPNLTRAKEFTTILVTLSFSETLDGAAFPPELVATSGSETLTFTLQTPAQDITTGATFSVVVGTQPDGIYTPTVSAQDLAGNRTTSAGFPPNSPSIVVDSTADTLVIQQDQVSYIRSPIGNAAVETLEDANGNAGYTIPAGVAFFELGPPDGLDSDETLPGDTFEFSGGVEVTQLRAWAEQEKQNLLGTARLDAPGGDWLRTDLRLSSLDTPQVYVTGLDEAGNESDPVLVENGWFVGSTALPAFGTSPHTTEFSSVPHPPLSARRAPSFPGRADSPDAQAEIARAERAWEENSGESPSGRFGHALAYDSARGRVVLFGGRDSSFNRLSDTWEWDGNAWTDVTPSGANTSPSGRFGHALAYDSARGRVVLFGGEDSSFNRLSDTWEWDGTAWTDVTPSGANPSPLARAGHALAYDSARGRVVLFGGLDSSFRPLSDTWEWDGNAWTDVTPSGANTSPSARTGHALAYDSARGRVVLFGGFFSSGNVFSDTWEWDGDAWTDVTPSGANTSPSARNNHALAYDSARGRVVLFGGFDGFDGSWLSDTWEWDGSAWTDVTPAGANPSPPARAFHALAYDSARGRVVLFGGRDRSFNRLSDTWEWDGKAWSDVTPSGANPSPSARDFHALAYDSARERVVLFGGRDSSVNRRSDTWEWDGNAWTDVTPAGANPSPRARAGHALAYDSARGRVVLFGGSASLSDTWEWDGNAWTDVTPAGANTSPRGRADHALAYDSARGRVVLFGGSDSSGNVLSDTWEWDGNAWTDVTPSGANPSPSARLFHALAYDSARGRVVLFGGSGSSLNELSDTWEWDGSAWTDVTPAGANASPPGRDVHALAYDSARGRVVLFGGLDSSLNELSDTWEWDGNAWTDVTPAGANASPSARLIHALAYDSARGRVVLFGGRDSNFDALSDTWESRPPRLPEGQLSLRLSPDLERDELLDIRVRAFCGGTYEGPSGSRADGAQLVGWRTGGPSVPPGTWEVLATHTTGLPISSGTAGLMDYQPPSASAPNVAQDFLGPERRMYFQCRLDGTSGSGFAEVGLDYMEVRVKYDTTP